MSIKLWFKRIPNPKLEEKLPGIGDFTRLFCSIKFRAPNGWSKTRDAIVDTGAPISVIPLDIWTDIENKILTEHEIQGINPRKECALPALIGKATCILLDEEGNQSRELEILSHFALTNLVPLIIGFKGILENFKLILDYKQDHAFAEEK